MSAVTKQYVLARSCAVLLAAQLTSCRPVGDQRRASSHAGPAPILLFDGAGTSAGDVAALERILTRERLAYSTVDSQQLNGMTEAQMGQSRLLILPGGNFEQIGRNLTADTTAKVRNAVRKGLSYLGICAGAFFAGDSPDNGLNLTSGRRFGFYALEAQGIRKAPVAITDAGGQTLDQYWEDGPQLTGWGAVAARYPDGTPAVVEGRFGEGWVVLSGVHPEAPESWRGGMSFRTPAGVNNDYAAALIRAALNGEELRHF